MTATSYLTWENFRASVLIPGEERVHRISTSPFVEIYGDGVTRRIGLWIEVEPHTTIPANHLGLALIAVRVLVRNGRSILEVSTGSTALQRQFYHFAMAVAERVIVEGLPATQAVDLELGCFAELLGSLPILGIERQIGLMGELLFLELLVERFGAVSVEAWLGPQGEPHDFRIKDREFEVKTTSSVKRVHTIHGADQLVPSKGCTLSLISIVLGPPGAGNGRSLADLVAQLGNRLASDNVASLKFLSALESSGYRTVDSVHYTRKFIMRRPMALVPVDHLFPTISRPVIQRILDTKASRVESIQYDVNVEGLECDETSTEFGAAIPNLVE